MRIRPSPSAVVRLVVAFGLLGLTIHVFAAGDRIVPLCFDSGTRVVREVAGTLGGGGRGILECYPPGSGIFLWFLNLLPEGFRIGGIEWGMSLSLGEPERKLTGLDIDSLFDWCIAQYPKAAGKYRAIVIGSPNGAVAHLASLLHAPFLTASFAIAIRHPPIDPDDVDAYAAVGDALASSILAKPGGTSIEVIDHYDPIHDRPLVKYANFLRIKTLELPAAYEEFILENLAPGGAIILVDCAYSWPQYTVGERSYFQVGGLGGIPPEGYLARFGRDLPFEERRESEWGCPEEFAEGVRGFAEEHGIELIEISYPRPEDYSLLSYRTYLECPGVRADELLLDSFNYQSPRTNVETGIPALWLPFDTIDTLAFAERFLKGKAFSRIYLALVPSFARSEDTVPLASWEELLAAHGELSLLGIDRRTFPADAIAPFAFSAAMGRLREESTLSEPLSLRLIDLVDLLASQR